MNYLESLPLSSIAKYAKGQPSDGIPFTGHPRVHSTEKNKLILVNDPLGPEPIILEFKLDDVLYVEEIPAAVTEEGEGVPMIKLWIKRGAVGMIFEPFEVNDPVQFAGKLGSVRERLLQNQAKK
jgi:inorganic pyrophosphatase